MALSVPVREFKAKLSHYLARAQAGEDVEITSRRRVVARLSGVAQTEKTGLARMVELGLVTPGRGGKPKGAALLLSAEGKSLSEMVLEDRD